MAILHFRCYCQHIYFLPSHRRRSMTQNSAARWCLVQKKKKRIPSIIIESAKAWLGWTGQSVKPVKAVLLCTLWIHASNYVRQQPENGLHSVKLVCDKETKNNNKMMKYFWKFVFRKIILPRRCQLTTRLHFIRVALTNSLSSCLVS